MRSTFILCCTTSPDCLNVGLQDVTRASSCQCVWTNIWTCLTHSYTVYTFYTHILYTHSTVYHFSVRPLKTVVGCGRVSLLKMEAILPFCQEAVSTFTVTWLGLTLLHGQRSVRSLRMFERVARFEMMIQTPLQISSIFWNGVHTFHELVFELSCLRLPHAQHQRVYSLAFHVGTVLSHSREPRSGRDLWHVTRKHSNISKSQIQTGSQVLELLEKPACAPVAVDIDADSTGSGSIWICRFTVDIHIMFLPILARDCGARQLGAHYIALDQCLSAPSGSKGSKRSVGKPVSALLMPEKQSKTPHYPRRHNHHAYLLPTRSIHSTYQDLSFTILIGGTGTRWYEYEYHVGLVSHRMWQGSAQPGVHCMGVRSGSRPSTKNVLGFFKHIGSRHSEYLET